MPDIQAEAEFEVFDDPAASTSTTYRLMSVDGATSLLITGTGFTFVNGIPTGGTITSVAHVLTATNAPIFTITNIHVSMADVGALLNDIIGLRSQITWVDAIEDGELVVTTANQIRLANGDGTFTDFIGSGFPVPPDGPLTGTVTSIRHIAANGTTVLTNVNVSEPLAIAAAALFEDLASDQLFLLLNTGANTVTGGGPVSFEGTNYYGPMYDGAGNDTITGGGPTGTTYVEFEHNATGGTINLATGVATFGADTNTLSGILGVGGTEFNDTITGNDQSNQLSGWGGDDTLNGGGGNDFLHGAEGNDTMDGGGGTDTALYNTDGDEISTGVTVSLAIAGAQDTIGAGFDTLIGIENLWGSFLDDTLTGDANANQIRGLDGNDIINGGGGVDHLEGDDGDDAIFWDPADLGDVWGGNGVDTLVFVGATPSSFNLVSHAFEAGLGVVNDTGANPWTQRLFLYDTQWRLDRSGQLNDDGTHEETDYDQANVVNWASAYQKFDALDQLTQTVLIYDSGVRDSVNYDTPDDFNWTTFYWQEDSLARRTEAVLIYDDGARDSNNYDAADAFDWTEFFWKEDSLARRTEAVLIYDDGGRDSNNYDAADAFDWTEFFWKEDSLARRIESVLIYDDGTRDSVNYDPLDAADWTTFFWQEDSLGRRTESVLINDDSSRDSINYDAADAFAWDNFFWREDTLGRRTEDILTYDDGSRDTKDYDETNSFTWANIFRHYDSGGVLVQTITTYDDGQIIIG